MKLECPHSHRTTSKIFCKARKAVCVFQRWRPCLGWYEFTDGANTCRLRKESEEQDGDWTMGRGLS